jgi:hypothetical protein
MSVPSDGFGGGGGRGEESGWRRPRPRAGAGPQRSCVGPCFTSVVECCCFPRAVMVPRDLQDVHPCNLTLQRQKAHQAAQNGTWRHSGTLRGTRWTPAHSEKKSLDPLRGPRTGAFSWSGCHRFLVSPSLRLPAPPEGRRRTPANSTELLRTITHYFSLLLSVIYYLVLHETTHPNSLPLTPFLLYT